LLSRETVAKAIHFSIRGKAAKSEGLTGARAACEIGAFMGDSIQKKPVQGSFYLTGAFGHWRHLADSKAVRETLK
jgi:hypothetical protein